MTVDCKFVQEHISAWMDGELRAESKDEIQKHLDSCDKCARELTQYEELSRLARSFTLGTSSLPAWELIEKRISGRNASQEVTTSESTSKSSSYSESPWRRSRSWRTLAGVLATMAASVLLVVSTGRPWISSNQLPDHWIDEHTNVSLNLQPLLELLLNDPHASIDALRDHYTLSDLKLADADANFGRPTFLTTLWKARGLPGSASPGSTMLLSLPSCQCPKGQCTCGEGGCNCIASICQRPDGSIYLVFEQCVSQKVSFGNLPVEIVKRNGHEFEEVRFGHTLAISFDWLSGKVVVVGLRNDTEVDSLFASAL